MIILVAGVGMPLYFFRTRGWRGVLPITIAVVILVTSFFLGALIYDMRMGY